MPTAFPAGLDNLSNPSGSSTQNAPSHASQHADANDAIEAIEAKVGVTNSAVSSTLDFRLRALEQAATQVVTYGRPGPVVAAVGNQRWRFPHNATIVGVSLIAGTGPTGADLIVDVNKNGASLFVAGTRPRIVNGQVAAAEVAPAAGAVAAGDYLTVDVDQVGSTVAGSNLTVMIRYRPT